MGYNTTLLILNDNLGRIKDNAAWATSVYDAVNSRTNVDAMFQTKVMKTDHADVFRLYATSGNNIIELSPYDDETLALALRMSDYMDGQIAQAERLLETLKKVIQTQRNGEK